MRQKIERDRMWIKLRWRSFRCHLALQFFNATCTTTGDGLETSREYAAHTKDAVQRIKRHQHDSRRAIGIRDYSAILPDVFGVDLRNHERHMRIHPKGRRFIDPNRVRLAGHRNIISGNVATRAEKGDVDFVELSITKFSHGDRFFAKTN